MYNSLLGDDDIHIRNNQTRYYDLGEESREVIIYDSEDEEAITIDDEEEEVVCCGIVMNTLEGVWDALVLCCC